MLCLTRTTFPIIYSIPNNFLYHVNSTSTVAAQHSLLHLSRLTPSKIHTKYDYQTLTEPTLVSFFSLFGRSQEQNYAGSSKYVHKETHLTRVPPSYAAMIHKTSHEKTLAIFSLGESLFKAFSLSDGGGVEDKNDSHSRRRKLVSSTALVV